MKPLPVVDVAALALATRGRGKYGGAVELVDAVNLGAWTPWGPGAPSSSDPIPLAAPVTQRDGVALAGATHVRVTVLLGPQNAGFSTYFTRAVLRAYLLRMGAWVRAPELDLDVADPSAAAGLSLAMGVLDIAAEDSRLSFASDDVLSVMVLSGTLPPVGSDTAAARVVLEAVRVP